jgi:PrcB C-terminal
VHLNVQGWILRQRNRFQSQFETPESILWFFVMLTLFILFFVTSSSEAYEVARTRLLLQVAATEIGKPAVQLPFQTIAKGYRSGVRESLQTVARNQAEWDSVWKKHSVETNPPPPPFIDFKRQIVVAVFLGEKPTGGYDVEIIRVEQSDGALVIHYREKSPLPGSIAIQALTQPFHIIQMVRDDNFKPTFRRAP